MAHNLTETATFTANVQVPDDGDFVQEAAHEPGMQALANRTKYLNERHVARPGSCTDNAIVRWNGTDGTAVQDSGVIVEDDDDVVGVKDLSLSGEVSYDSAKVRTKSLGSARVFRPANEGTTWTWNTNGYWTIGSNTADTGGVVAEITQFLRAGQVITGLSLRMQPGAARSPASRCSVAIWRRTTLAAFGTATPLGTPEEDDGTTNVQTIVWTPTTGSHTVLADSEYYVHAFKGSATGAGSDLIGGIVLSFTDPGPRNA